MGLQYTISGRKVEEFFRADIIQLLVHVSRALSLFLFTVFVVSLDNFVCFILQLGHLAFELGNWAEV